MGHDNQKRLGKEVARACLVARHIMNDEVPGVPVQHALDKQNASGFGYGDVVTDIGRKDRTILA